MNSFPHSCRAAMGTRPYLELGASVFSSGLPAWVRGWQWDQSMGEGLAVGQSRLSTVSRTKAAVYLKNRAKDCCSEVLTILIFIKLVAL